jgi:hypothetical protein
LTYEISDIQDISILEYSAMDTSRSSSTSLFQVYLRLRPASAPNLPQIQESLYPQLSSAERFLTVEPPSNTTEDFLPTHITLHPPSDRKRAVEKFAFTKVFEEHTSQLDIFNGTGIVRLIEGVISERRDGLVATLGVTGSGKVGEFAKKASGVELIGSRVTQS